MSFSKKLIACLLGLSFAAGIPHAQAQNSSASKSKLNLVHGPARATMDNYAQIELPEGYTFFDGKSTRDLMRATGEPSNGREVGLIIPTNKQFTVFFEFDDLGYVKDDDKDKLDADKLLQAIKRGTARGNQERVRNGKPPLEIVGWEQPP